MVGGERKGASPINLETEGYVFESQGYEHPAQTQHVLLMSTIRCVVTECSHYGTDHPSRAHSGKRGGGKKGKAGLKREGVTAGDVRRTNTRSESEVNV